MKKGITVLALTLVIVVMTILAGVGVYLSNDIMKSVMKNELAIELLNLQTAVDTYYIDNGEYPTLETIQISLQGMGTFELSQFSNEEISNNTVTLAKLDLATLGIKETTLGNNDGAADVYAVSQTTGKIYYVMGVTYRGETHYTLNSKLSEGAKSDIGVLGKRIQVRDVIFVVPKVETVAEPIKTTVVLPEAATLDSIVATNSVQIGTKTTYGDYQLIEVNTTSLETNYEIEVTYTINGSQNTVEHVVNNVDVQGPVVELSVTSNTNYTTITITATDEMSGVAKLKYEAIAITDSAYFEKYGKNISGKEINCYTSGTYTIYAIDNLGNVTLKTQQVTVN